jgi:hypothetical protein
MGKVKFDKKSDYIEVKGIGVAFVPQSEFSKRSAAIEIKDDVLNFGSLKMTRHGRLRNCPVHVTGTTTYALGKDNWRDRLFVWIARKLIGKDLPID